MNKTLTDPQIIEAFEREIKNDPDAYTRPDETVYQITAKELVRAARGLLATQQPEPRDEVTEEQPSLTNPLTPYGMLVRALRIVAGTTLYDMGQSLLLRPAKLSAMEFGREPVTPEIVREIATYFESNGIGNTRPALEAALRDAGRVGGA